MPTTSVDRGPFADRPFDVIVPSTYDPSTPAPLVVVLHGYTSNGDAQETYFDVAPLAELHGFLYVHPDGTRDRFGRQFWNATDACCNLHGSRVDDVGYLAHVISQIQATYRVDPERIVLYGHSNGGFMAYRMACERADLVTAVASLAGAAHRDADACAPTGPVSVVQIHGTADPVVTYDGGTVFGGARYPSAVATVGSWAALDGCTSPPAATGQRRDLAADVAADDTVIEAAAGCPPGIAVELWTIEDGGHVPALADDFSAQVIDFLLDDHAP